MTEPNELTKFNLTGAGNHYSALEKVPEEKEANGEAGENEEDKEDEEKAIGIGATQSSNKKAVFSEEAIKRPKLAGKTLPSLKAAAFTIMSSRRLVKLGKTVKNKRKWRASSYLIFEAADMKQKESLDALFPEEEDAPETSSEWLYNVVLKQNVSFLLIFLPFAALSHFLQWNPTLIFCLNFLAMIPLATILGEFTEELAFHTNQTIGGLINATFGNAVEVVVAIQALMANEIRVVQSSMLGSIFSNLLLVLGSCFFFGGLNYREQNFNSTAATANMSLLALTGAALLLPTPFAEYYDIENEEVLELSRFASLFLLLMYIFLLVFQLKTHAGLFNDDDEGNATISYGFAVGGLTLTTAIITLLSDWLVGSIDGFVEETGLSKTFVGIIILPIVGNAVEHLTAVSMAMKNKMDLALAIAIGSCVQIALFVIPFIVIVGWVFEKDMTIDFPPYEITLFIMSVFIVSITMGNTTSNWLLGILLITLYVMIALGFWFEQVQDYTSSDS